MPSRAHAASRMDSGRSVGLRSGIQHFKFVVFVIIFGYLLGCVLQLAKSALCRLPCPTNDQLSHCPLVTWHQLGNLGSVSAVLEERNNVNGGPMRSETMPVLFGHVAPPVANFGITSPEEWVGFSIENFYGFLLSIFYDTTTES